ncbi:MAG: MASE1 domain-containing protein, partial [Pseudomonadota bacterium]
GTFITPYIDAVSFLELPAIALAGVLAVRYGWTGILGCVLGSLSFHLLSMPWQLAASLAAGSGIAALLFNYVLRFFHPSVVTINQVSTVAVFAFIAAPIASAAHTVISMLSMELLGFTSWDSMIRTMMTWWFSELLLAYLTVPLLLSIFSYRKIYFRTQEKFEMGTAFVAMVIVSWLTFKYGQMLASSEIIIFVLLAFVLLAALRFKTIVTHAAIFIAALIAFITLIFNVEHIHSELYSHA